MSQAQDSAFPISLSYSPLFLLSTKQILLEINLHRLEGLALGVSLISAVPLLEQELMKAD